MAIKETNRPLVTASLMLAMFLASTEATIVATAMPSIINSLGGFELYSWVFSAFLLAQGAFIPIFGKLSDIYGRKPIFTLASALFLAGALFCGHAQTMLQLIIFRALQGIGAAGVLPVVQTIIGDIYSIEERARVQGLFGSVWGISSILGPTVGGIIVDYSSWPWIFFINIPLGLIAILGLFLFLHEPEGKQHKLIDYQGSALLLISVTSLLLFLIQGGTGWDWLSTTSLSLAGLALIAAGLFLWWEQQAPAPLLPLGLFKNKIIVSCDMAVMFSGALTLGISSLIPTFVQGVLGTSATVAGLTLGAMSIGWPLASAFSGKIMLWIGFRWTAVIGSWFTILSALSLLNLNLWMHPLAVALSTFLMGIGLGLTSTTFIVAVQSAVDRSQRGVATSSNAFMRMLGSTIGVAVFGNILNRNLALNLSSLPLGIKQLLPTHNPNVASLLLDKAGRLQLSPDLLEALKEVLTKAMQTVFWGILVTAIAGALIVWLIPKGLPQKEKNSPE